MLNKLSSLLVVLFLAACATAPSNGFGVMNGIEQGKSFYDVRTVRATSPGIVQIINRRGEVIGSAPVAEGTNTNVRVFLSGPASGQDLTAQLLISGSVVEERTINARRLANRDDD